MAFGPISEWVSQFSLQGVLGDDPSAFLQIFYLVISIAIYSMLIWHFYRFIARRDCFKINMKNHPKLIGFLKYFFIYPFVAFLFFTGFSLLFLFLTRDYNILGVLSTSFAVVVAIRITAYYNEDLSRDVAKMLPFALLAIVLISPSYFIYKELVETIYSLPEFFAVSLRFVLFIILTEWMLRILLTIKHTVFPKQQWLQDEKHHIGSYSSEKKVLVTEK